MNVRATNFNSQTFDNAHTFDLYIFVPSTYLGTLNTGRYRFAMSTLSEAELDQIYEFALQLAKDAGRMLHNAMLARCNAGRRVDHVEKESAVDLVTQTDEGEWTCCYCFVGLVVGGVARSCSHFYKSKMSLYAHRPQE